MNLIFALLLWGLPVTDATGLTGKHSFYLSWVLDDANNVPSAVQSQLGLKLTEKKRPIEILIVDHIDKIPSEN